MKVLLVKVLLFEYKKGLLLLKRRKMEPGTQSSYSPPLGLLYIGRSLEDEGHSVELIDFFCEKNPIETLHKSLSSADAVGLSTYTSNYAETAYIAKIIKDSNPDLPIFIGGPHCTALLDKSMQDIPSADIGVVGDGEHAVKDVMKAIQGEKQLSEIPGVYYRENGIVKQGKPPEIIKDLDTIPFPSRHLVDKYEYGKVYNIYFSKPKFTAIATSRGCPFHCTFCTRNYLFKMYRRRSVENVVEEFKEINGKFRSAIIVDDNFLADTKRAHEILDRLIELDINMELLIAGTRVDTAERELYKKMKKVGVKYLFYGIESGCQEVLDFYKKGTNLDMIRGAVNLAHEMGFFITGSFILGAPIETKKHIEESIKFACSLPLDYTIWRQLAYKYGSDIWSDAVAAGKITEKDGYDVIADSRKGLGIFTEKELEEFCRIANRRFYLRPRYLLQELSKMILRRDMSVLKTGLDVILS
jgi:anaerobic magnesium-protoporphyrin IX monomethyl ester cyclase